MTPASLAIGKVLFNSAGSVGEQAKIRSKKRNFGQKKQNVQTQALTLLVEVVNVDISHNKLSLLLHEKLVPFPHIPRIHNDDFLFSWTPFDITQTHKHSVKQVKNFEKISSRNIQQCQQTKMSNY